MSSDSVPKEKETARFTPTQKEIISGLSAGLLVTVTTHPLDVLKVRLQLDTISKTQHESYQRIFHSIKQLATFNGRVSPTFIIKDLYRGISPNIIGNTMAWSLYFSLYRFYKDLTFKMLEIDSLENRTIDSQLKSYHYLVSAYAAGFSSCLITNPIWVLKTRTLSTPKTYPGAYQSIADGVRRIVKEEGVKTFWRGLLPSLFGVLQSSIQFSIYDTFKQTFFQGKDLNLWQSIYLSATSKVISNISLYPFQVVRSRLQNYGNTQTMREVLISTFRTDGIIGFYKGLVPNILRVLPLTCITFSCYEQVKNLL